MAQLGGAWIQTGAAPNDREFISREKVQAAGYDREADRTTFATVVDSMPGKTPDERMRQALDETLGDFNNSYDQAYRFLVDNGRSGVMLFTSTGKAIGPRAFAGAMRAANDNPNIHPLMSGSERASYEAGAVRSHGQQTRIKRDKAIVAAEKTALAARKAQALDLYGTTDLRKVPKSSYGAIKERQQKGRQALAWVSRQAHKNAAAAQAKAMKAAEKDRAKAARAAARA